MEWEIRIKGKYEICLFAVVQIAIGEKVKNLKLETRNLLL
jgi:hypothetical protein